MTPSWTRAPHPRCPMRTAPRAQTQQPRRPVRTTESMKPWASELFLSPLVQILIPCRSECTSARLDYGGGPEDAPVPARGRFARRAPTEIPACWLKRSPREGRSLGGEEGREGVISPLTHLHPPPHHHLSRIPAQRLSPPCALVAAWTALRSRLHAWCLSLSARLASQCITSWLR
jgi:hypothetical protein